jgi:hypothetical protein
VLLFVESNTSYVINKDLQFWHYFNGIQLYKGAIVMPSTVVAFMQYDPNSLKLKVVFISGSIYEYPDVPNTVFHKMKISRSKGKFPNMHIKGHYEFKKLK